MRYGALYPTVAVANFRREVSELTRDDVSTI